MHLLNFKKKFGPKVRSGRKNTTIRKPRKRKIEEQDDLRIYTGLRTSSTELLGDSNVLKKVEIKIMGNKTIIPLSESTKKTEIGDTLTPEEVKLLSERDGFDSVEDFFAFFESNYELPMVFDLFFFKPLGRALKQDEEVIIWDLKT